MLVGYIEDITCLSVDTSFIFKCSTRYLTSEHIERVRYGVEHEKTKLVSTSGHVIFCLLYRHSAAQPRLGTLSFTTLRVEGTSGELLSQLSFCSHN